MTEGGTLSQRDFVRERKTDSPRSQILSCSHGKSGRKPGNEGRNTLGTKYTLLSF